MPGATWRLLGMSTTEVTSRAEVVGREIVRMFETACLNRDLWAPGAELDVWQPVIRIQAAGVDVIEQTYRSAYPGGQQVTWSSSIATERGVLIEFTNRSRDDEHRLAKLCAVVETDNAGRISHLRVHCTGEWPAAHERAYLAQGGSLTL